MSSRKVNKDYTKSNKQKQQTNETPVVPELASNQQGISATNLRLLIVFLFGLILYANTLTNQYAVDDAIVITSNQFTKKGLEGIKDIMTKDTFHGFFGENKQLVSGGRYRPFSLVTFAIEYEFFKESPGLSHLINILLYALTGLVLLKVIDKLTKRKENSPLLLDLSLLTTLLYIAHPLHTEVVANIKGRDEILSMLFSLSATWFLLLYNDSKKILWFILSCVVFFLGTLSKENALTFVLIIPALLYVFTDLKLKTILLKTVPYLLISLFFWYLRAKFTGGSVNMTVTEILNNPFAYMTSAQKFATIIYTWGKYLILLVFPHPLTHDYYYNQITTKTWSNPLVLISAGLNIALMIYGIIGTLRKTIPGLAVFIYWCAFSVVSNLVFPIGTTMSERFTYGSSLGFSLILAYFLLRIKDKASKIPGTDFTFQKKISGIAIVILLLYAGKTIARNPAWTDNYTLFSTDINTSPNSAKLLNSLGGETMARADIEKDTAEQKRLYQKSMDYLNRALAVYPHYSIAWMLLGNNYYKYKKDFAMAATCYQNSVKYNPNGDAYYNLAITQQHLQRWDDACKNFIYLIGFRPNDPLVYYNLGDMYRKRGKPDSSITCFMKVAQLDPKYQGIFREIGSTYGQQKGDLDNAIVYLQKALALDPKDGAALENIGIAYGMKKDFQNAVKYFTEATQVNPNNPNLFKNLAITYSELKQPEKAKACYERANQLMGKRPN